MGNIGGFIGGALIVWKSETWGKDANLILLDGIVDSRAPG